jgi:hypothetical protein
MQHCILYFDYLIIFTTAFTYRLVQPLQRQHGAALTPAAWPGVSSCPLWQHWHPHCLPRCAKHPPGLPTHSASARSMQCITLQQVVLSKLMLLALMVWMMALELLRFELVMVVMVGSTSCCISLLLWWAYYYGSTSYCISLLLWWCISLILWWAAHPVVSHQLLHSPAHSTFACGQQG